MDSANSVNSKRPFSIDDVQRVLTFSKLPRSGLLPNDTENQQFYIHDDIEDISSSDEDVHSSVILWLNRNTSFEGYSWTADDVCTPDEVARVKGETPSYRPPCQLLTDRHKSGDFDDVKYERHSERSCSFVSIYLRTEEGIHDAGRAGRSTSDSPRISEMIDFTKVDITVRKFRSAELDNLAILRRIESIYEIPLAQFLTKEQNATLFGQISGLIEIHQCLENEFRGAKVATLPSILLRFKMKLASAYGAFYTNLPNALSLIENDKIVTSHVKRCQREFESKDGLPELLKKPLVYLHNYYIILKRCDKRAQEADSELRHALAAMKDLSEYFRQIYQDMIVSADLDYFQKSIIGWDLISQSNEYSCRNLREFGRLVYAGDLSVRLPKRPMKLRYAFLFTCGLILCIRKDKTFIFKNLCPLEGWKLSWNFCGRLTDPDGQVRLELWADPGQIQTEWKKAFAFVFSQMNPCTSEGSGQHRYKLHAFVGSTVCHVCSNLLQGLIFQGYRCEQCHQPFHRLCVDKAPPCRTWFVGEMTSQVANLRLNGAVDGTFLVRSRCLDPNSPSVVDASSPYTISIKLGGCVVHIRVFRSELGEFRISKRSFTSMDQLVDWYHGHDLDISDKKNIIGEWRLKIPWRR